MPTPKDVLEQSELRGLSLLHVDKGGSARTLQSWTADEGFPDEDELAVLVDMHGEPGRYRLQSRIGKRAGKSATVKLLKGDATATAPKSSDGILATQLVRMAAEVTKMAQVAMQTSSEEKREAMALLREQAEEIAELRVTIASADDKGSIGEQVVEGALDVLTNNPELAAVATQGAKVMLAKVASPAKAKGTPRKRQQG